LDLHLDSEVFTTAQQPIPVQLAVALYNIGTFGNAKSIGQIATKFGVSEGGVENFTSRVVTVLGDLTKVWIKWPDVNERKQIGSQMAAEYFPHSIGFIDGSGATFNQSRAEDKQAYWSRKKKYCIQFQIVCDTKDHSEFVYWLSGKHP